MGLRRSLKRLDRRVRDSVLVQRAAAGVLAGYLWATYRTTRWRHEGAEHLAAMWAEPAFIAAVWHARLFPIAMLRKRGRRAVALISPNRDGDLLARVMANTGAEAIRASSRDPRKPDKDGGGAAAAPKVVDALKGGAVLVITPDGPRGPRMRAKPGAALFSAAADSPVLPVAYSVRRAITLKTWDRFLIPTPFNRGVFVFGAPIPPADPNDRDAVEARSAAIEAAITEATRKADRLMGRRTPEPGPTLTEAAAALAAGRKLPV